MSRPSAEAAAAGAASAQAAERDGAIARRSRPLRVLHCPTDVGGNPIGLAAAERALGVQSTVAVYTRSWLGHPADLELGVDGRNRYRDAARRLWFFVKALRRWDVFHFNFGQTLLPMVGRSGVDLPLLKAIGKRVFMTYQGCDARQAGFCTSHFALSCCGGQQGRGLCSPADDAAKARRVAYAVAHAHRVFAVNPDLLHVVPRAEFVPYASVDPATVEPEPPSARGRLVVLHAPTNRAIKGTAAVEAAASDLAGHLDVEWRFVERLPHAEALARYAGADLVVDQLRVGWYGAFAVEMMARGKPVVCYVRPEDLRFVPTEMARDLPLIQAKPDTLRDVLRDLLAHPERLRALGERSRRFVERWHDPRRIARAMIAVYEDPQRSFWEAFGVASPERSR